MAKLSLNRVGKGKGFNKSLLWLLILPIGAIAYFMLKKKKVEATATVKMPLTREQVVENYKAKRAVNSLWSNPAYKPQSFTALTGVDKRNFIKGTTTETAVVAKPIDNTIKLGTPVFSAFAKY